MLKLSRVFVLTGFVAFLLVLSKPSNAAQVNEFSEADVGEVSEEISVGGEKCEDYVNDRLEAEEGPNEKDDGSKYFLSIGFHTIGAPVGDDEYIKSRVNTFDIAFLKAKGRMAEFISTEIAQQTATTITDGKFSKDPKKEQKVSPKAEDNSANGAWNKGLAILNNELNGELKKRGIGPKEATKIPPKELKKKIDDILSSTKFSKITETLANTQLKGVRRLFVYESAKPGEQGSICVVALHSKKLEQLADAALSGDASLVPDGTPRKRLKRQLPHYRKGARKLVNFYGVEMRTDDRGKLWLVSYSQFGARNKNKRSIESALGYARTDAMGNLRAFFSEQMEVKTKQESSQNTDQLQNNMSDYKANNSRKEEYISKSKKMKFPGIKRLMKWAVKHPTTGQVIVGVAMAWSPGSMKSAQKLGKSMNTTPQRSRRNGNEGNDRRSRSSRFSDERYKQGRGAGGGTDGGSSKKDF